MTMTGTRWARKVELMNKGFPPTTTRPRMILLLVPKILVLMPVTAGGPTDSVGVYYADKLDWTITRYCFSLSFVLC
jgi:hypothetical protein